MGKTRNTANISAESIISVDINNDRIGINSTTPGYTLDVGGTINATSFSGSGVNLTGIVTSISAGSGISIDQSTGNVTITATGGGGSGGMDPVISSMIF